MSARVRETAKLWPGGASENGSSVDPVCRHSLSADYPLPPRRIRRRLRSRSSPKSTGAPGSFATRRRLQGRPRRQGSDPRREPDQAAFDFPRSYAQARVVALSRRNGSVPMVRAIPGMTMKISAARSWKLIWMASGLLRSPNIAATTTVTNIDT